MSSRARLPRPSARSLRRGGLGLLTGALAGWFAGLMRAPRPKDGAP